MAQLTDSLTDAARAQRQRRDAAAARAWADLEAALKSGQRALGVSGVVGAAKGRLVQRLARLHKKPVVLVAPDEETAELLERDVRFFLGPDTSETEPVLLRLPADDLLPYDDLTPDRALVLGRLRALFHLHLGTPFRVLVTSTRALARRVLPRRVLDDRALLLARDQELPIDQLAQALARAGYENVPLVEDPGAFAVRGGIVDLFSPLAGRPARIEFFGDTIESIKFFDPETQRTLEEVRELAVCPARELLFDDRTRAAAIDTIRAAADEVSKPTAKVRELIEEVQEGVAAFGLEALLPGFYDGGLEPATAYLPADALYVLDDPLAVQREADDLDDQLTTGFRAARERGDLSLEPGRHCLSADELLAFLTGQRRVELQALVLGGLATSTDPNDLALDVDGDEEVGGRCDARPAVSAPRRWRPAFITSPPAACGRRSPARRRSTAPWSPCGSGCRNGGRRASLVSSPVTPSHKPTSSRRCCWTAT